MQLSNCGGGMASTGASLLAASLAPPPISGNGG
jgi:hypothetical protein